MPRPVLPLLHALLRTLRIPITPTVISAVSPSLLLLLLEALSQTRVPLRHDERSCATRLAELAVVKCLLGVLADDLLGLDLSVIDPHKVVEGSEPELEVVIMAMVVLAKRRGLLCEIEESMRTSDLVDEQRTLSDLPEPLTPDVTYATRNSSSSVHSKRLHQAKRIQSEGTVLDRMEAEFGLG